MLGTCSPGGGQGPRAPHGSGLWRRQPQGCLRPWGNEPWKRAWPRHTQETGQASTRACAQARSPITRECSNTVRHLIERQPACLSPHSVMRELPTLSRPSDTPCDATASHEECAHRSQSSQICGGAWSRYHTSHPIPNPYASTPSPTGGELLHSWREGLSSLAPFTCLLRDTRQITT